MAALGVRQVMGNGAELHVGSPAAVQAFDCSVTRERGMRRCYPDFEGSSSVPAPFWCGAHGLVRWQKSLASRRVPAGNRSRPAGPRTHRLCRGKGASPCMNCYKPVKHQIHRYLSWMRCRVATFGAQLVQALAKVCTGTVWLQQTLHCAYVRFRPENWCVSGTGLCLSPSGRQTCL